MRLNQYLNRALAGACFVVTLCTVMGAAPISITTGTLPNVTVGAAYSQTIGTSGGKRPFTWSITSGALPAGLSLDPGSGTISGTPTIAGTYNFTVRVIDKDGDTASQSLQITVDPLPPTVTTSSLSGATVGTAYSQTLSATGGSGGYTWTSSGGLPAGLTLSSAGVISGTPTAAGTSTFTVTVTDSGGRTGSRQLTITSSLPAISINTASLPAATVGASYSQTLSATGGSGGFTWTSSGALPAGLTLSSAGVISGTPTAAGTTNFTVTATDSGGRTASKALSVTVNPAALTVSTGSLPNGTLGTPYSQTLSASGGSGGYTWSATAGSPPAGLTLSPAGVISGTPTAPGTATFTATVTDSGGRTASKSVSITIDVPTLTVTTGSLPPGVVGVPYSQTLAASGGSGGYTWKITAGAPPAGLTLSAAGTIEGTPTAGGTATFTATVTDSGGRTASKSLSIAIDFPALTITTSTLPVGVVGLPYSQAFEATGGSGGYTWKITAGTPPAGLTLSPAGALEGTPTAAGVSNFTVTVTDSGGRTVSKPVTVTINPPVLTVSTASLPNGSVGVPYSQTLTSTGGAGGNTWSVTAGALPAGLALAPNGTISGTPANPETANFTVQVKDAANGVATKALTLTITAATLTITTQGLPPAAQGVPYSQTLTATGGTGVYRWSLATGSLPAGLTLDPAGTITGSPEGGTSTFTLLVTDTAGAVNTKTFTLTVVTKPAFTGPSTLTSGVLSTPYSAVVTASGGQPPYTFSVLSGQLPPGLSLNTTTGEITGRPTQTGTFTFTLQLRDAAGVQAQATYQVTVASGVTITTPPVLPSASVSVPYQAALEAAGGTPPYTWSGTAGTLPAGIAIHADGKIDGTPTTAGTFTFTATATDANGGRATKDFTITVVSGLTITTAPQLSPGVPSVPYTDTLVAIGGTPPYVWSTTAGALPAGVRLDPTTGALSGTPATAGTYNFTVTVTDSANRSAQKAFTLVIAPGVTFTTAAALPNAVAGTPYAATLEASGGQTPYSWRISDGALPDGLTINSSSGVISGTPTTAGTFNFTVQVVDATGLQSSRVFTIVSELPAAPTLVISGVSSDLGSLQQPALDLMLTSPYPVAITGRLDLGFAPAAGLTDDPSVQFSSGGRSVPFTIAANDTHATFPGGRLALQTGSVAGTIQLSVASLAAGSVTLPPPSAPVQTAQIAKAPIAIRSATVTRGAGGFQLQVVGVSTTRDVTSATVRFLPSGTEVTVPLTDAATAWFKSANSTPYGGQFTLTLPFSFVGGSVSVDSVSVVLTNTVGPSQAATAPY